jgi:hypothetical protein
LYSDQRADIGSMPEKLWGMIAKIAPIKDLQNLDFAEVIP